MLVELRRRVQRVRLVRGPGRLNIHRGSDARFE